MKYEILTDKSPIQIFFNKIKKELHLKSKLDHLFSFWDPKPWNKLLWSTEKRITIDKNGERVPQLKIIEVILVPCNVVNNQYSHDFKVLSMFVPHKSFGQLLHISPTNYIYRETIRSRFSYIWVWLFQTNVSATRERKHN